jgi:hypothetical protein
MKVIIAGSRHMPFSDYPKVAVAAKRWQNTCGPIAEVVCGMAKGADTFGMKWAICEAGLPVKKFPADWNKYGNGAGLVRNREMRDYADGLIAFVYNDSPGTTDMIREMQRVNKPCLILYNGVI